jgi:acetylornithine deacetylase/succinyl-diaminopimelate desuccinylase-like protein
LQAGIGTPPEGLRYQVRFARELQRTYTGVEEEVSFLSPSFLMRPEHPVVAAAAGAAGVRNGSGPARVRPWQFATDGGWSCGVHGIPTIGFAPGEERYAHTNRERLDVEEARWAYGRYPEVIGAVQGAVRG